MFRVVGVDLVGQLLVSGGGLVVLTLARGLGEE